MVRTVLATTLALLLAGCMPPDRDGHAAAAVETFHRRYDAGEFKELYAEIGPLARQTFPEPQFRAHMSEIRARLGAVRVSTQTGSLSVTGTSGRQITLTYATQFEKGFATEVFLFQGKGNGTSLEGYTINSPTPIVTQ